MTSWQPQDGTNPYGRPSKGGNWHDIWQRMRTPCPACGSATKRLVIEKDRATIVCGPLT